MKVKLNKLELWNTMISQMIDDEEFEIAAKLWPQLETIDPTEYYEVDEDQEYKFDFENFSFN